MEKNSYQRFLSLVKYARPYWKLVVLQFVLMGISISFGLLKPWPMKVLVDNVVGEQAFAIGGWEPAWTWTTLLLLACVAYLVFHAGESLIQISSGTIATLSSSKMIRDLRSQLLDRVQALSLNFHDSHKVGDLVHRISHNSTSVETAFQSGFMGVVKSAVTLVAMFVIMMTMSPTLTMIALVVVPFLLVAIRLYAKKIHQVSLRHQNQEGAVSSILQEILSSIRLVKAYNREGMEHRRFIDICTRSVRTRLRNTLVQNSFGFLTALILAAGTALMFWVGIRQVRTEVLTLGQFLVFISYLSMLYAPLSVLSYTSSSVQGALGGAHRLFEILDSDDEIPEAENPVEVDEFRDSIVFNDVSFQYEPDKLVLEKVNLDIRRGESVAIVGETGGGKSTLLNLVLRFYDPTEGAVSLDGNDLRDLSKQSLRRLISYVPQDVALLSDTLRENIAFGRPDADEDAIIRAATQAQAHSFILNSTHGYDTEIGERGIRLSMGQRQRISIARAIVRGAPIMLLDEPTSALDVETEALIMEHLRALHDVTLVLVAHRISTVRFADRIIVVSGGKIVESGTHGELMEKEGMYSRLWNRQVKDYQEPATEQSP